MILTSWDIQVILPRNVAKSCATVLRRTWSAWAKCILAQSQPLWGMAWCIGDSCIKTSLTQTGKGSHPPKETIDSVYPPSSNSHKWRFRLGFPTKNGIILVVTVTAWGVVPNYRLSGMLHGDVGIVMWDHLLRAASNNINNNLFLTSKPRYMSITFSLKTKKHLFKPRIHGPHHPPTTTKPEKKKTTNQKWYKMGI